MPTDVATVHREHVEAFLIDLQERGRAAATVHNRYRALVGFFKFLVDEDAIDRSPMERMSPPHVPEQPVAVLSDDDLKALLGDAAGKDFESVRDTAIIRLLVDTGMRRAEIRGLSLEDVDLDQNVAFVMGKGRRPSTRRPAGL